MCTNVICVSQMCRSLGEILFLCLGPDMLFFFPRNNSVGCFVLFSQEVGRTEEKEREEMFFVPGTKWQYVYAEHPLLRDAFCCNAFSLLFMWSEFREMICFCFPQG